MHSVLVVTAWVFPHQSTHSLPYIWVRRLQFVHQLRRHLPGGGIVFGIQEEDAALGSFALRIPMHHPAVNELRLLKVEPAGALHTTHRLDLQIHLFT